jgi:hypothetical protein
LKKKVNFRIENVNQDTVTRIHLRKFSIGASPDSKQVKECTDSWIEINEYNTEDEIIEDDLSYYNKFNMNTRRNCKDFKFNQLFNLK